MPENPLQSKDLGFYFALGQVGLEMVVPIAVGVYLDDWLGWSPWAVVAGAVLGLFGGLFHLLYMLRKHEEADSKRDSR